MVVMTRKTSGSNLKWTREEEDILLSEIYHNRIFKVKSKTQERKKILEKSAKNIKDQLPSRTEDGIIQRFRHILRNLYGE